jgi:putative oxidoreductase
MALVLLTSCVQKSYKRTVVFTLDVSKMKDIKKVGIRGNDKPLNWDTDFEMIPIKKDRLYRAVITGETGYLFTEVKFTVNGDFELKEKDNRKVVFQSKDTTYYNATFDRLP